MKMRNNYLSMKEHREGVTRWVNTANKHIAKVTDDFGYICGNMTDAEILEVIHGKSGVNYSRRERVIENREANTAYVWCESRPEFNSRGLWLGNYVAFSIEDSLVRVMDTTGELQDIIGVKSLENGTIDLIVRVSNGSVCNMQLDILSILAELGYDLSRINLTAVKVEGKL